ncbi:MAG: tetratricopeptide repeat protein [Rhodocyclaceae bacterium]|nr:tetratricopeptide repeat protein [Rhodocyclaceae bacterium]
MVFPHQFRRRATRLAACLALSLGAIGAAADTPPELASLQMPGQALSPQVFHDVLLAEIALARGRLDIAVPVYQRVLQMTQDVRVARRATELALYARRMDAALAAAKVWAALDPESIDAQRVLSGTIGGSELSAEQLEMRMAEGLAKSGPRLPGVLLSLNRALTQMPDKAVARSIIERVTEPYLEFAEAHFARAHAAFAARDTVSSLNSLDAALTRRPDWEQAVVLKAQIQQADDPAQAVATLESYLGVYPDNVDVRRAYGRALLGVKRYPEARAAFESVIAVQPDDQSSRYAVAMIALETKDLAVARQHLEALREADYPDADALEMGLAQVAEAEGDMAGALAHFDAVTESPRRDRAQLQIARMLAQGGDVDAARQRLRALEGGDEERASYRLIEAQLLRDAGRVGDALRAVDEGLQFKPDDPDLLYESAMLADRLGRREGMEGRLRKLIALKPDYAHAYNALGYSLADRGERLDEAEALIRRAVALRPEDPFIMDSLGWVRYRQGAFDEARQILEKAYALRADPEIAAHLGEVMWAMGDRDAARSTWRTAAGSHPESSVLSDVMRRYGL